MVTMRPSIIHAGNTARSPDKVQAARPPCHPFARTARTHGSSRGSNRGAGHAASHAQQRCPCRTRSAPLRAGNQFHPANAKRLPEHIMQFAPRCPGSNIPASYIAQCHNTEATLPGLRARKALGTRQIQMNKKWCMPMNIAWVMPPALPPPPVALHAPAAMPPRRGVPVRLLACLHVTRRVTRPSARRSRRSGLWVCFRAAWLWTPLVAPRG